MIPSKTSNSRTIREHSKLLKMSSRIGPTNNVLYFGDTVDVRICPKNGLSTFTRLYQMLHDDSDIDQAEKRYIDIEQHASRINPPFREDTIKIAIRRDPVERYKSAIRYIHRNRDKRFHIDELEILDPHFFSQSYYMGHLDDYDFVFPLSEMKNALSLIFDNVEQNVMSRDDMCLMWENRSENDIEFTSEELTTVQDKYSIDYIRGWY